MWVWFAHMARGNHSYCLSAIVNITNDVKDNRLLKKNKAWLPLSKPGDTLQHVTA